jgi:hypothetical protein
MSTIGKPLQSDANHLNAYAKYFLMNLRRKLIDLLS